MFKNRLILTSVSVLLLTTLTGCFDLLNFPNVSVSQDGDWIAYLSSDPTADELSFTLNAVNLDDGTIVTFSESDQQFAYAWHPTENRIAYYNVAPDDTTTIRVSDLDDPNAGTDIIGTFAFPTSFYVTKMEFSPDGTQLAMSVILTDEPLDLNETETSISVGEPSDESTDESLVLDAAVYIADLEDGSVTAITTAGELFPSIVNWSPNGDYISFVAWENTNGDELIDISGSGVDMGGDITQVFVYEVASGTLIKVSDGSTIDLSPTWISDSAFAYVAINPITLALDQAIRVITYDVSASSSVELYNPVETNIGMFGINASPDGSQLAFVALPLDEESVLGTGDSDDDFDDSNPVPAPPAQIYTLDVATGDLTLVYEYAFDPNLEADSSPELALDVPIWTPDGSQLIIAAGNPIFGLTTLLTMEFNADFSDGQVEGLPIYPMVIVDVETGEALTITNETIGSSGFVQALFSFALSADDAFGEDTSIE